MAESLVAAWFHANGVPCGAQYKIYNVSEEKGTACYYVPWPCGRCGGRGGSEAWAYTGWTCYECGGSGHQGRTKAVKIYSAAAYAKLAARQQKTAEVRQAKEVAKQTAIKAAAASMLAEFKEVNAVLVADLEAYAGSNTFIIDLRTKLHEYGPLSAKQISAVRESLARAAKEQAAADCPSGRVALRGEILTTRLVESFHDTTVLKMLVRAVEGFKVWCTVPSGLDAVAGVAVAITVTIEPSTDDKKFGFGKRPVLLKA